MLYIPTEENGWVRSKEIDVHASKIQTEPEDVNNIRIYRSYRWFHIDTGVVIREVYIQHIPEEEFNKYKDPIDIPLPEERSNMLYIESMPNATVARCNFDFVHPELRIDKKTGKFYCTCPSSFLMLEGNDEIGECSQLDDVDAWTAILRDNIVDAIKEWNKIQLNRDIINELKTIYKENNTYTYFVEQFENKYATGFKQCDITDGKAQKCSLLLGLLGIDFNFYDYTQDDPIYNYTRFIRGANLEKETEELFNQTENILFMHLFRWVESLVKNEEKDESNN